VPYYRSPTPRPKHQSNHKASSVLVQRSFIKLNFLYENYKLLLLLAACFGWLAAGEGKS